MKIKTFQEYCKTFEIKHTILRLQDIIEDSKKYKESNKSQLYIQHNKKIFQIKKELIPILKQLLNYNSDYYEKIKLIGQLIWSNGPSQYLLKLTYEKNKKDAIKINEKSSYLYSKKYDLFYDGILNKDVFKELSKKSNYLLLIDSNNEAIGIGEIKSRKKNYDKDDIAIYNTYNLSKYMR